MNLPQISFQVRINERATLEEMGRRVAAVLGCEFRPSENDFYEEGEALESFSLGLWISISADPEIPEGELRNYVLMGLVRDEFDYEWGDDIEVASISPYILGLMLIADGGDWYIPDLEELYEEAGLDADD